MEKQSTVQWQSWLRSSFFLFFSLSCPGIQGSSPFLLTNSTSRDTSLRCNCGPSRQRFLAWTILRKQCMISSLVFRQSLAVLKPPACRVTLGGPTIQLLILGAQPGGFLRRRLALSIYESQLLLALSRETVNQSTSSQLASEDTWSREVIRGMIVRVYSNGRIYSIYITTTV